MYVSTADVDSCCAFRILKSMMCSDGIPFSAYPVSGYQELQGLGEKLPKDGQNRSVVLINCGGTENVKELLGAYHAGPPRVAARPPPSPRRVALASDFKIAHPPRAPTAAPRKSADSVSVSSPLPRRRSHRAHAPSRPPLSPHHSLAGLPENTRVFVFDSHRPLDLENTRSDNRDVLVLRDEREGEEHFPEPDSDYGDSDDSDDDSDEDGSESDDGSEASDDENDGEGSESDAENDENDPRGANDPNDPEDPGGARGRRSGVAAVARRGARRRGSPPASPPRARGASAARRSSASASRTTAAAPSTAAPRAF